MEVKVSSMKVMTKSKYDVGLAPNAKTMSATCAFAWTMTNRWIFCRVLSHELRVRSAQTLGAPVDIQYSRADARSDRRRKPGQDANRFKTDEETGKLVIPAEESDSDIEVSARRAANDVAGSAYRESLTSVDGFARGSNGRIKFNKDTKKRRRENVDEDGDIEMADVETLAKSKKNKRRSEVKLGYEFKARVCSPRKQFVLMDSMAILMYRKREAMSKKGTWILTLIYLYLRLRKEKGAIKLGSLESGDTGVQTYALLV